MVLLALWQPSARSQNYGPGGRSKSDDKGIITSDSFSFTDVVIDLTHQVGGQGG
jgi:hypothetical protein